MAGGLARVQGGIGFTSNAMSYNCTRFCLCVLWTQNMTAQAWDMKRCGIHTDLDTNGSSIGCERTNPTQSHPLTPTSFPSSSEPPNSTSLEPTRVDAWQRPSALRSNAGQTSVNVSQTSVKREPKVVLHTSQHPYTLLQSRTLVCSV